MREEKSYSNTNRDTRVDTSQQAPSSVAMEIQAVSLASVHHWDHSREFLALNKTIDCDQHNARRGKRVEKYLWSETNVTVEAVV